MKHFTTITEAGEQPMGKVKVNAFSISLDGFGAGPGQDLEHPLGVRGLEPHACYPKTEVFNRIHGQSGGAQGIDNELLAQSFDNVVAWIIGRNMFGPVRGPWKDESWKGWWGNNPPFRSPVFVLTHYARSPLPMEGGTTFYFVTNGPEAALKLAKEAAEDKDVRVGGGVSVIRQYLAAGRINELHLAISPVVLGEGEHLLQGINLHEPGFAPHRTVFEEMAMHVFLRKTPS
jgi:dihydrofolate reductase